MENRVIFIQVQSTKISHIVFFSFHFLSIKRHWPSSLVRPPVGLLEVSGSRLAMAFAQNEKKQRTILDQQIEGINTLKTCEKVHNQF